MRTLLLILFSFILSGKLIAQDHKNVVLLDQWTDTSFTASLEDIRFNDVLGFKHNNILYAIIGSTIGTHILKIENNQLKFVDFVPGKYQSVVAEHRDYAVYQNYIYAVCDEGTSSLQIIDFSYLPDSVSVVYDDDLFFQISHTVFIDTAKAKLYACGANNSGMKILDISNPISPSLFYDFTSINYVHDCRVVNDTASLNCGYDGLHIYYFGGGIPIQLGVLDFYADQGYNHSGSISPSGNAYAFTDETEGKKIKLCYLNDLADIKIDELFATSDFSDNVAHDVVLLENIAICSYYKEGLRIFDVANLPIHEIAAYDTYLPDSDFKLNGAWGVFIFENDNLILISDRQSGLFLFYFPIDLFESGADNTYVTNVPFIDENSILITRNNFETDNLYFTIASTNGELVYEQEDYKNWVNIPLTLSAGAYVYAIFNQDKDLLEKGKFVKAN